MNKTKLVVYLIISLILISTAGYVSYEYGLKSYPQIVFYLKQTEKTALNSLKNIPKIDLANLKEQPLKSLNNYQGELTTFGILLATNKQRQDNGVDKLSENSLLDVAAQTKINDMFAKQYFEHINPDGNGPDYFVATSGYKMLIVGENLAMGGFKSDQDLVDAWMNSPGHRRNILNNSYQEIGLAVKKGIFNNDEVWLAVQTFATPISVCNTPSDNDKLAIESNQKQLDNWKTDLGNLKKIIDSGGIDQNEMNQKVREYNQLVDNYNTLLSQTKTSVDNYNKQADEYNQCLEKYKSD